MADVQLSLVPRLADTHANQSVVEYLEEFLELARAGELVGIAIVGYDKGRNIQSVAIPGENPTLLLGGLTRLSHRVANSVE